MSLRVRAAATVLSVLCGCVLGYDPETVSDASAPDAGADAGPDAGRDASVDADVDAGPEDRDPPTMTSADAASPRAVRVRFSEPMAPSGATDPASYCIEVKDGDASACTPAAAFAITRASRIDPTTFELALDADLPDATYTVHARGVADLAGNPIGDPHYADFDATGALRVVAAAALDELRVEVTLSRSVDRTPDSPGSAGCSSAAACAERYRLVGAVDLGEITTAVVQAAPRDDVVVLTHALPQTGAMFTVIGANGRDGDGFDDAGFPPLADASGARTLGAMPDDRAAFVGAGMPLAGFGDGPILADPFGDGSSFTHVFGYRGQVHLGPNRDGTTVVRTNPDGSAPEIVRFRFPADVDPAGGSRSDNSSPPPYPSIGFTGCERDTPACGPDNEDGRGLFASGTFGGREWLVAGGGLSGGNLDYIYMTSDTDATLDFHYVDMTDNTGGATKGFSSMRVFGGRLYMGFPDTGGNRPYFLSLLRPPDPTTDGLDARQNGNGGTACDPALHDACYLSAERMPGVGNGGGNRASMQMIDFLEPFGGLLYLGNNGGLMRSTVAAPLDYRGSPGDWAAISPTATAYTAIESLTTELTADLTPADRAWPRAAGHGGALFAARNTVLGPQLFRCAPATTPPAEACDAGDWTLVAPNTVGDARLTQLDDADNTHLAFVIANGAFLYVGFDNPTDGVAVYRTSAAAPSAADFRGEGGCVATAPGCEGLGGDGFGSPTTNTRLFDAVSLRFSSRDYLYVTAGDGTGPVRVFRTSN